MNQSVHVYEADSFDDVLSPETLIQRYPHLQLATLKWDIHERHRNGAAEAGCFIKNGKRIDVIVPRYLNWKTAQRA